MGFYINPPNQGKEEWLAANGKPVTRPDKPAEGNALVCVVDNGPFTAAGVAFDAREFKDFSDATDPRPKTWWEVPKECLAEVGPWDDYKDKFKDGF